MHPCTYLLSICAGLSLCLGYGCTTAPRGEPSEDRAPNAFMDKENRSQNSSGHSSPGFTAIARQDPNNALIQLASSERQGSIEIILHNRSDKPWRIAELESHCRLCRVHEVSSHEAAAGESITIGITAHAARLERLPSRRFIRIVLVQPDNSNHEGWIPITITREAAP